MATVPVTHLLHLIPANYKQAYRGLAARFNAIRDVVVQPQLAYALAA